MKRIHTIHYLLTALLGAWLFLGATGCSDFEDINKDPSSAGVGDIKAMWALNQSMVEAQMNPHIQERIFVIYWMRAARYQSGGGINTGGYSDDYNSDYVTDYINRWLTQAHSAIKVADEQLAADAFLSAHDRDMTRNVREFARIWFCYLLSEYTDNFGPAPLNGFVGEQPTYSSVKDVYHYMLTELKDAASKIDISIEPDEEDKKSDKAYAFDPQKWIKYANSMRMRLAMRMAEMDAGEGKAAFEDAAKSSFIDTQDAIFQIQEADGWNALSGVFSRPWNALPISKSLVNLTTGLGGVPSAKVLADNPEALKSIKPSGYYGMTFPDQFPLYTNDPSNGLYMDGIPYSVDPRMFRIFSLPGDESNFFAEDFDDVIKKGNNIMLRYKNDTETEPYREVPVKYTFNGVSVGNWDKRANLNVNLTAGWYAKTPTLQKKYRDNTGKRLFFGPWESYFLLSEAALKGWSVPISAKEAYEKGIRASFEYNGCAQYADEYLTSTSYSLVGTSVAWDHTAEPPATQVVKVTDGKTGAPSTFTYTYPEASKTLYGKALNDHLTKIITQKYLAQCPYLCLEAWSDYRRTGLPFRETPAADASIPSMPQLTQTNAVGKQTPDLFPQRLKYPSKFQNGNPEGYDQAVQLLGGKNEIFTPLPWAKK